MKNLRYGGNNMKTIRFVFKDYTPIEIQIDENDVNNLMAILGYLNQGAVVVCTDKEDEYFMDMSFEDKE